MQKEGVEMSEEDLRALYQILPDLFSDTNPDMSKYLQGFLPRLEQTMDHAATLKRTEFGGEALKVLVEFLEQEQETISHIPNETTREQLLALLATSLNVEQLEADLKSQATKELGWGAVKLLPGSSLIDIMEAAQGRTLTGEEMSMGSRALNGLKGAGLLFLDLGGLATFGLTTGASTAIKVANEGKVATKGLELAHAVQVFAALPKIQNLGKVSEVAFKFGDILNLKNIVTSKIF